VTWSALNTAERISRIRHLTSLGMSRTEQATRLGLRLTSLSQFCSANGLVAANANTTSEWSGLDIDQRIARIRELRDDGLSVRQIAAELGVSHPVIYGFCQDNGMERLFERRVKVGGPPMIPARPVAVEAWTPGANPVTLMDLEDGMCRWPVDVAGATKQMFCGCAVKGEGESYCSGHGRVAQFGLGAGQ
jgi:hypothetical protein